MLMIRLPRLYAVIDSSCFLDANALFAAAQHLEAGGCSLVQYRNKSGNARIMLEQGQELRRRLGRGVQLMMNDRADLCLAAGFDGVHVGQDDLSPEAVRNIVGPKLWLESRRTIRRSSSQPTRPPPTTLLLARFFLRLVKTSQTRSWALKGYAGHGN